MFAVIFDLEGQLDCTLHATEAAAKAEAARLSEKYATERANYSAAVAVQAVTLPAPTAQPAGVWRIVSGQPDTARALYWSNANGWGGIAGSDAYGATERATLQLPVGGAWWFDADEAAPTGEGDGLERHNMLALSTAHIWPETSDMMAAGMAGVAYEKGDYGFFVPVPSPADEIRRCEDLAGCLAYARARGFSWLMFDCDAEQVPGLPVYDWEGGR